MTLDAREKDVCDWLAAQHDNMLALLADVVNTDSNSYDKAGVDAAGVHFERFFASHGLAVTRSPSDTYGDMLRVELSAGDTALAPVVLMGHRDTVFPTGEVARRPFRIEDGRAYGPGVSDMKSGLVLNAFVMAAFKATGHAPGPLVDLISSDEEIASPFSRPLIEEEGRRARVVLNGEPGRISGNIVSGRKGGMFLAFEVHGRAAHSGANFADGISSIGEMAYKIVALHALTDLEAGITVNVGLVEGGQSVNTTAPLATGQIDVRYVTPDQRTHLLEAIGRIMETATVPGSTATFSIRGEFLPLVATEGSAALREIYLASAADAGLGAIDAEFTGGCADSGITASMGAPTICGLGPVGAKAHTPDEFMIIDTMVPRAQALALTILRLGTTELR